MLDDSVVYSDDVSTLPIEVRTMFDESNELIWDDKWVGKVIFNVPSLAMGVTSTS